MKLFSLFPFKITLFSSISHYLLAMGAYFWSYMTRVLRSYKVVAVLVAYIARALSVQRTAADFLVHS